MHILVELAHRVMRSEYAFSVLLFCLVLLGGAGIAAGILWCGHLVAGLV